VRVVKMLFGNRSARFNLPLVLAVAAAFVTAWVAHSPFVACAGWVRLAIVMGCLASICGLFQLRTDQRQSTDRTVRRHIEGLLRQDLHDLANSDPVEHWPALPPHTPWRSVLADVHQRLREAAVRADEMEHACASAGVRFRRLNKENQQFVEILDHLAEPLIAVNAYHELVWVNHAGRDLFDITVSTEAPQLLAEVVKCPQVVQLLNDTCRRKSTRQRSAELSLVDNHGRTRWFRATCRALGGSSNDEAGPQGAVVILADISSQKGIQKRHAEFVAAASHEMKTPLAGIRAYVELLQDGDAEDEATRQEFLGVIDGQAVRLQRLIENLLNVARIEAGVVKVDKQMRPLNELLEQACNVVQPTAEQKSLELAVELSSMYLAVRADRDMLVQATINLLSNAIKYTEPGGKVTLRSRMEDNAAVFEVEDTGIGLSEEDRERVFERFYRVKKGQDMARGTGLGLPLVKHIVEDVHGGSLAVTSELGRGSLFQVTLPTVVKQRLT
jgi:two-component system phosphate regulon sensor histidine kinase PhoR